MLNPGTIGIVAVALVALVAFWQGDRALQRQKGASAVTEKVKTNNANLNRKADVAARKSADPAAPGVRLPNYRD